MAIVQPGKRPAKRFEKSRILGGKIARGRKVTNAELNVVPMVDMMTMLVIFLLQQFSATGEVLYMQKDIRLPDAAALNSRSSLGRTGILCSPKSTTRNLP